ncbi:uncharacterized protein LDX57_000229 [Aspergillus melleus]|uniref:uncharacterized protein n=1 Tax=Aspergillus melleus TaxID=138277 RepID=UPI001E8DA208|nr:uncharacterized protein LDX57_000229 [Aspergillus melleus]KAH8422476.1 hypothetical protein LDX57_000229 [Aspergillus melleus]
MKFLILVAALASVASTADICRTSRRNCGGAAVCCTGIRAGQCCNLGDPVSHILYRLPANSRGRSWTRRSCTGEVRSFPNRRAGNVCHVPANGAGRSARWLEGLAETVEEPVIEEHHTCAEPDTVYYEDEEGGDESAALPGHLSADEIMEALEEGVSVRTLIVQEVRDN